MELNELRKKDIVDTLKRTQKYYTRIEIAHMLGFKKVYPLVITILEELVEADKIEALRVPHWNGIYKWLYAAILE